MRSLGVTRASITTLHTMAPQDGVAAPLAAPTIHPAFAQILNRFRRDGGDGDAR